MKNKRFKKIRNVFYFDLRRYIDIVFLIYFRFIINTIFFPISFVIWVFNNDSLKETWDTPFIWFIFISFALLGGFDSYH